MRVFRGVIAVGDRWEDGLLCQEEPLAPEGFASDFFASAINECGEIRGNVPGDGDMDSGGRWWLEGTCIESTRGERLYFQPAGARWVSDPDSHDRERSYPSRDDGSPDIAEGFEYITDPRLEGPRKRAACEDPAPAF